MTRHGKSIHMVCSKTERANGRACASPNGDGYQRGKRALNHHENLGNHTCKHHSRLAGTDKRRCHQRPTGRSDSQNPIARECRPRVPVWEAFVCLTALET